MSAPSCVLRDARVSNSLFPRSNKYTSLDSSSWVNNRLELTELDLIQLRIDLAAVFPFR